MKYFWRVLSIIVVFFISAVLIKFLSFDDTLTKVFAAIYLAVWIPFSIILIKQSYEE